MHVVIFLMSDGVRFLECCDNSSPFSSSFEMFWNPARMGGVKKGLNVSMANSSGVIVSIPLVMFVAIPVWMTMSSLLCHLLIRRAAVAPFFVWISCRSLCDGSSGTVSPSGELAKRMACWKSRPIFFQDLRRCVSSDSSSDSSGAFLKR